MERRTSRDTNSEAGGTLKEGRQERHRSDEVSANGEIGLKVERSAPRDGADVFWEGDD